MTAERVDPPRWRRRRPEAPAPEPPVAEPPVEPPVAEPVPVPRPALSSRPPAPGASWAGRASAHRREQVRARGPQPTATGPTGPVDTDARRGAPSPPLAPDVWSPVVEVLRRYVGSLSAVLLCTADGDAIAVHGVPDAEVAAAAGLTSTIFTAGVDLAPGGVDTVQLSSGTTHTVIVSVRTGSGDDHVLSVTAQDVSPGVLLLRTRQAADDLGVLLVAGA